MRLWPRRVPCPPQGPHPRRPLTSAPAASASPPAARGPPCLARPAALSPPAGRTAEAAPGAAGQCRGRARRAGCGAGTGERGGAGLCGVIGAHFPSPPPPPSTPARSPLDATGAGSPRASAGTTTFHSLPAFPPAPPPAPPARLAGGAEELVSGALGEESGSPGSTVRGA